MNINEMIEIKAMKAAAVAMTIPGQMRRSELAFLYRLARQKGPIIEIGCLHGRSTAVLVKAASEFNAIVTSVDPFYPTPNTVESNAAFWQKNIQNVGLESPTLMETTSHKAASQVNDTFGLVFIDGGHTYEDVSQDIKDWAPKVKKNGLIAFHDMFQYAIPGVAKAVTEWWLDNFGKDGLAKWRIEGQTDFLIAFRKVSDE